MENGDLQNINTEDKFKQRFPEFQFIDGTNFPDFESFNDNFDGLVLSLLVYASKIMNKEAPFHDHLENLLLRKEFMSCSLKKALGRQSRLTIKWTSLQNILKAIGKSMKNFSNYGLTTFQN